jgi:hypothetical protein
MGNAEQMLSSSSIVGVAGNLVSCDLEGEAVIFHLDSGVYYGLDPVGASVWNLIQEPRRVQSIRDALLAEYDVEAERCERDLMALLQKLQAARLVVVRDASAS